VKGPLPRKILAKILSILAKIARILAKILDGQVILQVSRGFEARAFVCGSLRGADAPIG
jgi:hypothetical protein